MAEKDLNIYFTGVTTDGDTQSDPNASLGGKRSGTILESISASAPVNVTGVAIDEVPASSGTGSATLAFTATGATLAYTAPGDTAGAAVDVSTDGTYEIYSNDSTKYMIVTVVAASLPGTDKSDTITLSSVAENLFDSVGSGEAQAGSTEYRAVMVKNDSAAAMNSMVVWIETNTPFADDHAEIGIEAPTAGAIQSVADEATAPASVTFSLADGEANGLSIGNLASGDVYGVWLKRVVSSTNQRYANNSLTFAFKADTV
jgi:hypothetical protein